MKKVDIQNENAPRRVRHYFYILPSAFFVFLVRVYQLILSPAKNVLLGPAGYCRFEPSCSQYAVEALKTHGACSGSWLAVKRVCRCHPWGAHGEDPVPPIKSAGPPPSPGYGATSSPSAFAKASADGQSAVPAAELRVSNVGFP